MPIESALCVLCVSVVNNFLIKMGPIHFFVFSCFRDNFFFLLHADTRIDYRVEHIHA